MKYGERGVNRIEEDSKSNMETLNQITITLVKQAQLTIEQLKALNFDYFDKQIDTTNVT